MKAADMPLRRLLPVVGTLVLLAGCGPSVTIITPQQGEEFEPGAEIAFSAFATGDGPDGLLTGDAIVWRSDVDGEFGRGTEFTTSELTAAGHIITATATDSTGRTAVDEVVIAIIEADFSVTVTAPADGTEFALGAEVSFACSVTDEYGAVLTPDTSTWSSSLDGEIGTGTDLMTTDLSEGLHTITVTATSQGDQVSDQVSIMIVADATLAAAILMPLHGEDCELGEAIAFTGYAEDTDGEELTGEAMVWSSDVDGQIGTGTDLRTSELTEGTHTITLTATYADNRTESDSVAITVTESGRKVWHVNTGDYVYSSPAVSEGYVYVGSNDGNVYCLDAISGEEVWQYETQDYVVSSPAVLDGRVYVGSDKVYCLDAATGDQVWEFDAGGYAVRSSPAVSEGRVYVGVDKVYCLDASTGEKVWEFDAGEGVFATPALYEGMVYVGGDRFYCLDATDGSSVWDFETEDWVEHSPAVMDGQVYVTADFDKLYCLDAASGTKLWEFEVASLMTSPPAVSAGRVYVGADLALYCLDSEDGAEVWQFRAGQSLLSSPVITETNVYVGGLSDKVFCLEVGDGTKVWEYETGSAVPSSPAIAGGYVYVGSRSGRIYCLHAAEGDNGSWPMFRLNPERTAGR